MNLRVPKKVGPTFPDQVRQIRDATYSNSSEPQLATGNIRSFASRVIATFTDLFVVVLSEKLALHAVFPPEGRSADSASAAEPNQFLPAPDESRAVAPGSFGRPRLPGRGVKAIRPNWRWRALGKEVISGLRLTEGSQRDRGAFCAWRVRGQTTVVENSSA